MKISHPRFLNVGKRESLNAKFPACLEKKTSQDSDIHSDSDVSHTVFLFPEVSIQFIPVCWGIILKIVTGVLLVLCFLSVSLLQDTTIQGETPLLWPLWFRAALPGNISLHISIYYEMGDISSAIRYRTLRMQYNLQVCTLISTMKSFLIWLTFKETTW